MTLISLISFALGIACYSVKELQAHGKLKWMDDPTGFWGSKSWVRKYKPDYGAALTRNVPDNWYYRFFKLSWKERFPLSATLLVLLTDGAHLMQTAFKVLFCISIVTYSMEFSWWMVLVYFVEFGVVFTLVYKFLSK